MRQFATAIIVLLIALLVQTRGAADQDSFKALLSGDQEVPPLATDMTGKVRIEFNDDLTAAEFTLTVNDGVRVQQAHIHCAPRGVNGPIVVFLAGFHAPGWDVDGKWIDHVKFTNDNIVNDACGKTLKELRDRMEAGDTYVNVHTKAHPGGEIRGQIVSKE